MNTPDFPESDALERRLSGVPLRPPPAAWRQEILGAAASVATTAGSEPSRLRRAGWVRNLLWPSPYAWASVATAWIVILTVNHFATPEPSSSLAGRAPSGSAAFAFIAHRPEVTELLETEVTPPSPPRSAVTPGPRSAATTTNHTA